MRFSFVALVALLPLLDARNITEHQGRHSPSRRSTEPEKRLLADVRAGICLKVRADTSEHITALGPNANVNLAAGTCICIDGSLTTQIRGLSIQTNLEGHVVSSTGLSLGGDAGAQLASKVFFSNILSLQAAAGICVQANANIALNDPHSIHDFSRISTAGCCARTCSAGYRLDPVTKRCVSNAPTCSPTEILCGGSCYSKTEYTCPSGIPQPILHRREIYCPADMQKCPVGAQGWECVNIKSDIESCGGCMYGRNGTVAGTDCTAIPHIDIVTCQKGACHIDSCQAGFMLSADGKECEMNPSRLGDIKGGGRAGFAIQRRRS